MIGWAIEALIASTLLMVAVLLVRAPVRRVFGPQVAYALWALPALRLILPPLPQFPAWRAAAAPAIGDTITVGQTTGRVTQIDIRATTITDSDGKHLVVPNKQLITANLINWTLINTASRLTFSVQVAEGPEPETVRRLLLETAASHEQVMRDPAPSAAFQGFGDYGLLFKVYVFVDELAKRTPVANEINNSITQALEKAGYRIAFTVPDYGVIRRRAVAGADPSGDTAP